MSERATLEALLARVLEGEGPDRKLDARIYILLTGGSEEDADYAATDPEVTCKPPRYTASLDAALTLVPEGWHWSVSGTVNREYHARIVPPAGSLKTFVGYWSEAKTAPRALTVSCLKARMEAQPLSNP